MSSSRSSCLLFLFSFLLSGVLPAEAQKGGMQDTLRVMFYNVENLFDVRDDSLKDDEDFLPQGFKHWTFGRYRDKLVAIARVVAAVGDYRLPDLVGLCEVENDTVLYDLTRRTPLVRAMYDYLITSSSDQRGVDVALLYRKERFKPLNSRCIPIRLDSRPTRDILHVTGVLPNADTLDVFVAHFPSRYGGTRQSEPRRRAACKALRQAVDSLSLVRQQARMVVMGDFNASLRETFWTKLFPDTLLTDLLDSRKYYSYCYQGDKELLDHLLVSPSLLRPEGATVTSRRLARVVEYPFLLTTDPMYGFSVPLRTYLGPKYLGGFSDHLPVAFDLLMEYLNAK